MNSVFDHIEGIRRVCENHSVQHLYLFGSAKTEHFKDQSDVDLLILFNNQILPEEYFNNFMAFKEEMESMLSREIDLVEDQAVRNPVFRKVLDREKTLLYERAIT